MKKIEWALSCTMITSIYKLVILYWHWFYDDNVYRTWQIIIHGSKEKNINGFLCPIESSSDKNWRHTNYFTVWYSGPD